MPGPHIACSRKLQTNTMNRFSILAMTATVLSGAAFAQQNALGDLEATVPATFSGVYHVATGQWDYNAQNRGTLGDVIFNNTAPSGFYDGGMAAGNTYVDEGRVPSLTSAAPLGTNNSYTLTGFEIGYCTSELEVAGGGPGAHLVVGLVDKFGAGCDGLGDSVPVSFTIDITGAPASATAGAFTCHTAFIDLTGLGLCLSADGEGGFDGGDLFGYSIRVLDAISGGAGAFISGDPLAVPDDTVFTTGGLGDGSGLDAQDLTYREGDGTSSSGCIFFGGYPANPFASHHFKLYGSADGLECANCPNDDRYDAAIFAPLTDDCANALALNGAGIVENLTANGPDEDFFRVSVPAATTIDVLALFSNSQGDLDMNLWDGACGTQLDSSGSVSDNEDVTFTNFSGAAVDVTIEVFAWPAGGSTDCADYDLDVSFTALNFGYCYGDGGGTACPCANGAPGEGCANSTGAGAVLGTAGDADTAVDTFALTGSGLPATTTCLYFQGTNIMNGGNGNPFGDGLRCIAGNVIRLQTVTTDAGGLSATTISLSVRGGISSGQTMDYQMWYRDTASTCGAAFNTTNARRQYWN